MKKISLLTLIQYCIEIFGNDFTIFTEFLRKRSSRRGIEVDLWTKGFYSMAKSSFWSLCVLNLQQFIIA